MIQEKQKTRTKSNLHIQHQKTFAIMKSVIVRLIGKSKLYSFWYISQGSIKIKTLKQCLNLEQKFNKCFKELYLGWGLLLTSLLSFSSLISFEGWRSKKGHAIISVIENQWCHSVLLTFAHIYRWLNLKKFFTLAQISNKKVPNYSPEHYPAKKKMLMGVI